MTYSDSLMTDHDAKTPLHDEIVTWCFNNHEIIINKDWFIKKWNTLLDRNNWKIEEITIEKPIIKFGYNTQSVIGFADLFIYYENDHPF